MFRRFVYTAIYCVGVLCSSPLAGQDFVDTSRTDIEVVNCTEVNSKHLEFSPAFYGDGVVYVSTRLQTNQKDKNIGESFFEIFYADKDIEGRLFDPARFSVELSSQFHEGPLCFNKSQNVLFISRNNMKNGEKKEDSAGVTRLKIYQANRGEYDWFDVTELPFNGDDYSTCHPAFIDSGNSLIFASDRPGGIGGMDLWISNFVNSEWTDPVNLGPAINTKGNEVFPSVYNEELIFFASDGHGGFGGLDLFAGVRENGSWSAVQHLPKPVNSSADDLSLIMNETLTQGYFSSSRSEGEGKDDLYLLKSEKPIIEAEGIFLPFEIYFTDANTGAFLNDASVRVYEQRADGLYTLEGRKIEVEYLSSKSGEGLEVKFKESPSEHRVSNKDGLMKLFIKKGKTYLIQVSKEGYQPTQKELDFDDPSSFSSIFLVGMNRVNCSIVSGRIADEETNAALVEANVFINSTCLEEPVKVEVSPTGVFSQCLPCDCDYSISCGLKGFMIQERLLRGLDCKSPRMVNFFLKKTMTSPQRSSNNPFSPREAIEIGEIIVLDDIHFDRGSDVITVESATQLKDLVALMTSDPNLRIELTAHTDSRGRSSYNLRLSEKRARSAKFFLVSEGIDVARIEAFGMGEKRPRNNCVNGVDCSEEEHAINRRLEVRILDPSGHARLPKE